MFSGYMIYWSEEYFDQLQAHGDQGPLKVVYSSHHVVMPELFFVDEGDTLYPTTIKNGELCVCGRLLVERIEPAFDYLCRETGRYYRSIISEGAAIRQETASGTIYLTCEDEPVTEPESLPPDIRIITEKEKPHLFHQEPMKCCADLAYSGKGSAIRLRSFTAEQLNKLWFEHDSDGPRPIRRTLSMTPAVSALYGQVRKMTYQTKRLFDSLFQNEE